jgi:hypothetical protein
VWAGERQGPIKLASACCSASFSALNTHIETRLTLMTADVQMLSTATCTAWEHTIVTSAMNEIAWLAG